MPFSLHYIRSRCCQLIAVNVNLDYLAEICLSDFSTVNLFSFFPFPYYIHKFWGLGYGPGRGGRFLSYCRRHRINNFCKDSSSFYWRIILETKIWVALLLQTLFNSCDYIKEEVIIGC